nr:indole-3-glycerol-phosphate synthase TrpC [Gemmatimonadota bacterium]
FGGSLADLVAVRSATRLPLLRKDFLVTESQLADAMSAGASAALLIVRAIEPVRLAPLARFADGIGLEILFEVRDEIELARALDAGATIIGVNNRNLESLVIDPTTVERILPLIPSHCIAVAESGYTTREQVAAAGRAGADAVLIGSSFSASADPAEAVRGTTGVTKASRD